VEYREKNNIVRNDFMQLLIDLKNNIKNGDNGDHGSSQHDGKGLTMEEIAAQAFVFFIAGYETSSTTMTYCLFELALNQDVQDKVRQEVNAVLEKYDGKLTYDAIMEMKYMRQVIDETLRKYPPVPLLNRKCVEDYQIPETDLTIERNTAVIISVLGLHHDAEYFPDPENFDPDRFTEENKSKIKPFTYLPFGEGPRNCIGIRFGVMQAKVGLAVLLKNYKFSLNTKTQIPLQVNPFSFILSPLKDIWLNVTKIEE